MTTFVVSLYVSPEHRHKIYIVDTAFARFLPHTIDFNPSTPAPPTPQKSSPPLLKRSNSSTPDLKQELSLLSLKNNVTPPQTPDSCTIQDPFFPLQNNESPALHFSQSYEARSTLQTDSLVPDWGKARIFNQPRSCVSAVPPSTVLQYTKQHGRSSRRKMAGFSGTYSPREVSREKALFDTAWTVKPAVQGNGGLANAMKGAENAGIFESKLWVGTLGFPTDTIAQHKRDEMTGKLEHDYDGLTVFVHDHDFDGHYSHYCKQILWPVFHYQIPDHPKSKAYEDHSWCYYVKINEAFAERVVSNYKHGDTIWIHDYHLLLVPAMIRKKLPDARIGFFLHTAFPSSEVFRCLAMRRQLLEGMCGANIVVFQAAEYTQHFLQTCSRLMVVEATSKGIQLKNRFIDVANAPIGIVPSQLQTLREAPEVLEWVEVLRAKYRGKKLIVARDKLDGVRGVRQKMLSYELFLNMNPEWREKVVLIQVATSTSTENTDLDNTVSDIVTRVNAQHSSLAHQALVFLCQDIAFPQYLALLSTADVLMVTPLRDGMNLTCHEYLLCQDRQGGDKQHGPLILSEFTGSASIFDGNQLSVNPWDYQQCARSIKQALEMADAEKATRHQKLLDIVRTNNGINWVKALADMLECAYTEQQTRDAMSVPRLSLNRLSEQYKSTSTRLFVLDLEGTLATACPSYSTSASDAPQTSTHRINATLKGLMAASPGNIVYVTSERKPAELAFMFAQVPGIGLIAENGSFVRCFSQGDALANDWHHLADVKRCSEWKKTVRPLLEYYHERVVGSWIEERHCSLELHYEHITAPEEADTAAALVGDCVNHINDSCHGDGVRAVPTAGTVLVESIDFNKQTACTWVFARDYGLAHEAVGGVLPSVIPDGRLGRVKEVSHESRGLHDEEGSLPTSPDFLMVAGDDRQDEVVFRWANELGRGGKVREVVSVYVGKRNTEAGCTLSQGTTGKSVLPG